MIPYTLTPNAVNVLVNNRMRTIDKSHQNFEKVLEVLKTWKNWESAAEATAYLSDLVDIPSFVAKITEGRIQIGDGAIRFDGKAVEGVIVTRMLEMHKAGFDVRHLARFLDRLQNNPIESARAELYIWLEHSNLPITEDGHFLAWKKVRDDYKSFHDGRTDNSIGAILPRIDADTNRHQECSNGYHFCAYSYLQSYYGDQGRVMIVKVNPAEVAAIPSDYNNAKGRAFTYEIVGEVPAEEAAQFFEGRPVVSDYDPQGVDYYDPIKDQYFDEDDLDDDDEEDDVQAALDSEPDEPAVVGLTESEEDEQGEETGPGRQELNTVEGEDEPDNDAGCECDECNGYTEDEGVNGDDVDQLTTGATASADDAIPALTEPVFEHRRKKYPGSEIVGLVTKYGQRGFQRLTGVPRSTLQEWLKKLS